MCAPTFFGVNYVINPWMEGNIGRAARDRARTQWEGLRDTLAKLADIESIEPVEGLPDMPFVANAGLLYGDTFIPSRFRFPQRQGESEHFVEWFREHGYRIEALQDSGSFEGEGDALFQPGEALLWCGYGVRTSLQVYKDIAERIGVEIALLRLVDERFYHLDTCFCPLPDGRVMFYPHAFDQDSRALIRERVAKENRIEVPASDALRFACNAVAVGDTLISNYAGSELRERLGDWGYAVETCPLDEFILAGGAAKCLVLHLEHEVAEAAEGAVERGSHVCDRRVDIQGQLLDTGLMNEVLDCVTEGGGSFEVEEFHAGLRHDQESQATVRVVAPSPAKLNTILGRLLQLGARVPEEEVDAQLETVTKDGVAPRDFYSTTIYPTDVRVGGQWIRARGQRMDVMLVVRDTEDGHKIDCTLLRDLREGDRVVCGVDGIRIQDRLPADTESSFEFMASSVSSERRVELIVENIAWDMRRIREREGKIVVVAGPVVIHTGGGPYLAKLIAMGYVQALLGGNAIAVHDIESDLYGTSLGVDLARGANIHGGHRHHLQAINRVRECGGIAQAVEQGVIRGGVMYECVRHGVPFSLAGSIRDDGPLPETHMDLLAAQDEYANLIQGADMILMLSSMLHSIGTGNMTPAGVRLICVDISPAVVTKLSDRGSVESTGVVTDVGLFLNLLTAKLSE
ncbi:MAG: TIGR00300 family protein [Candidatus Hydrogenedentes bacterium]|nr:TIGR00300 family protein [Candidatus Hydrogenedentota bacterium]